MRPPALCPLISNPRPDHAAQARCIAHALLRQLRCTPYTSIRAVSRDSEADPDSEAPPEGAPLTYLVPRACRRRVPTRCRSRPHCASRSDDGAWTSTTDARGPSRYERPAAARPQPEFTRREWSSLSVEEPGRAGCCRGSEDPEIFKQVVDVKNLCGNTIPARGPRRSHAAVRIRQALPAYKLGTCGHSDKSKTRRVKVVSGPATIRAAASWRLPCRMAANTAHISDDLRTARRPIRQPRAWPGSASTIWPGREGMTFADPEFLDDTALTSCSNGRREKPAT